MTRPIFESFCKDLSSMFYYRFSDDWLESGEPLRLQNRPARGKVPLRSPETA